MCRINNEKDFKVESMCNELGRLGNTFEACKIYTIRTAANNFNERQANG